MTYVTLCVMVMVLWFNGKHTVVLHYERSFPSP